MRKLIVFPGGGSPLASGCKPMFDLLEWEGQRRGWEVETLTYHHAGHEPSVGSGLTLPNVCTSLVREHKTLCANRVFALSFGVNVVMGLLVHHQNTLQTGDLRLWAPVSRATYERLYTPERIPRVNERAAAGKRGVYIPETFLATLQTLEDLCPRVRGQNAQIATGTDDRLTSHDFAVAMTNSLRQQNAVHEPLNILGGIHEMNTDAMDTKERARSLALYLDWIFNS